MHAARAQVLRDWNERNYEIAHTVGAAAALGAARQGPQQGHGPVPRKGEDASRRKTVQQDAKTFGLLVNEAALARESGITSTNKQLVKIGGAKNLYEGREDLEPTLDTIVYDTGLMTLTKEGGHYNDDSSNTIFDTTSGAQQARVKVYVDFKRKVLWRKLI